MNSYLEKIKEKKKRIKELEGIIKELDVDKKAIEAEIQIEKRELLIVNNEVLILQIKKRDVEDSKKRIKFSKKCGNLLAIILFIIGSIALKFNFNWSNLLYLVIGAPVVGIVPYLITTISDRKIVKNVNVEALESELEKNEQREKELENKVKKSNQKLNETLEKYGYYSIKEEISRLSNEIEELKKIRIAAIDELLDDLLEQQELADREQTSPGTKVEPFKPKIRKHTIKEYVFSYY